MMIGDKCSIELIPGIVISGTMQGRDIRHGKLMIIVTSENMRPEYDQIMSKSGKNWQIFVDEKDVKK